MFEPCPSDCNRELEKLPSKCRPFRKFGIDAAVDAFINPRHRNHDRRPDCDEILAELRDRAGIGDTSARHHGQITTRGTFQRMRHRQEGQEQVVGRHFEALQCTGGVLQHVPMRQHDALGLSGCARRVDDARHFRAVGIDMLDRARSLRQPVDDTFEARIGGWTRHWIDAQRAHHTGKLVPNFRERFPLFGVLEHQHPGAGVSQDVCNVVGPVGGVERHGHQIESHRGLIEDDPVDAVAQHDRDPVAGLQPVRFESRLPACDQFLDVAPGVILPSARLVEIPVRHHRSRPAHAFLEQSVQGFRNFRGDVVAFPRHDDSSSFFSWLRANQSRKMSGWSFAPGVTA